MGTTDLRHLESDEPRVLVVDGSKLVRKLIHAVLEKELPGVRVADGGSLAEARALLEGEPVDLVTTALVLPDGDGLQVARMVREAGGQRYVPVIVISGDVQSHLEDRRFTEDVTDYFDKGLGHNALAAFIRGYVHPQPIADARLPRRFQPDAFLAHAADAGDSGSRDSRSWNSALVASRRSSIGLSTRSLAPSRSSAAWFSRLSSPVITSTGSRRLP